MVAQTTFQAAVNSRENVGHQHLDHLIARDPAEDITAGPTVLHRFTLEPDGDLAHISQIARH